MDDYAHPTRLDEQIPPFSDRTGSGADRFHFVVPNVVGQRIMYGELIGTDAN
ncbi:MAG: hypothetical protein ABSB74_06765 [Tepidisphaeraceae bacterium]